MPTYHYDIHEAVPKGAASSSGDASPWNVWVANSQGKGPTPCNTAPQVVEILEDDGYSIWDSWKENERVEGVAPTPPTRPHQQGSVVAPAPPPPPPPIVKSKTDFPPVPPTRPPPIAVTPVAKAVPLQPQQPKYLPPVFTGTAPVFSHQQHHDLKYHLKPKPPRHNLSEKLSRQETVIQAKEARKVARAARMRTKIEATIATGNAHTIQECMESVARMFEEESADEEDTTTI